MISPLLSLLELFLSPSLSLFILAYPVHMFTGLSALTSLRISNDGLVLSLTGIHNPHVVLVTDQL